MFVSLNKYFFFNIKTKIMEKISLKLMQNSLTRAELKTIMAGSGGSYTPECTEECSSDSFCAPNTTCPRCNHGTCGS